MAPSQTPTQVLASTERPVPADTVLDALDDDRARSIMAALDDPRTAREVADACELPLSTVYRKLGHLADTPLVEERTRIRQGGHHASQYRRTFSEVTVDVREDGLGVALLPRERRVTADGSG